MKHPKISTIKILSFSYGHRPRKIMVTNPWQPGHLWYGQSLTLADCSHPLTLLAASAPSATPGSARQRWRAPPPTAASAQAACPRSGWGNFTEMNRAMEMIVRDHDGLLSLCYGTKIFICWHVVGLLIFFLTRLMWHVLTLLCVVNIKDKMPINHNIVLPWKATYQFFWCVFRFWPLVFDLSTL